MIVAMPDKTAIHVTMVFPMCEEEFRPGGVLPPPGPLDPLVSTIATSTP
jgi:hypothetical protein